MKRTILLISLMVFSGTTMAMQIGEIARFDKRRPALERFKVDNTDLQDFNQDGIADISVVRDNTLYVIDPVTGEELWTLDMAALGVQGALLGFLRMFGECACEAAPRDVALFYNEIDKYLWIVNLQFEVIEYQDGTDLFMIAVLERPREGDFGIHSIMVAVEKAERGIVIIGETNGTRTAGAVASHHGWLPANRTADFQLGLKYQADPGQQLAYDPDLFDPLHDMDIDGDEHMDIPMIIEDDNNEPIGVVVRSGENFEVLWQFPFPAAHTENIRKGFFGFVNLYGDASKEVVLGENLVVTLDGTVHTIAENFVTLDVNDVDGDGYEDIIGLNTADSTIVVYGAMTATSVEGYDPADIHFRLFQNYPNPFNPSTTIAYAVVQPGTVELTVYNLLGQAVRTLFRGQQGAGDHSHTWDGTDDGGKRVSSGMYLYRLKVGQTVRTRRMLFLK